MKTLGEGNGLATMMLGLCGLVFAAPACDGGTSDDGGADTQTTQPAEDTGSETEGGDTEDLEETEDDGDDTGPPPEGLGCDPAPACDKGAYGDHYYVTDEASMHEIAGYTSVEGTLIIRASDMTCLNFLGCLESVQGINIENNEYLTTLDGLQQLQEARAPDPAYFKYGFILSRNTALTDVSALTSLNVIAGGDLSIFGNDALEDLDGFNALESVYGDIIISSNRNLVDISGFNGLQEIRQFRNPNPNPSPGDPQQIGGSLGITKHANLERVSGFTNLIVIYQNLTIQYNDVLTRLMGLYNLQAMGGGLVVTNNPDLCVSEAAAVGGDLAQGPDLSKSSTVNNKDC